MKLNSTTKFLSCIIAMLFSIAAIAQPANDNVCDAIDITGGADGFVASNAGATVQQGETQITPPSTSDCSPGGWCDFTGDDGGAGIGNSIWFKFDAPAGGSVTLSACLSDFDTQLAVYEVGDCSDFTSFTFVWATDDQAECGVASDTDMTPGLSSEMTLECLTAGQTYYILVDGWDTPDGAGIIEGAIDMALSEITPTGDVAAIESITPTAPTCMGGADGTATAVIAGPPPYTFAWSTGEEGLSVSGLAAGDYTFTVTDACGNSAMETVTVPDGPAPTQIVAAVPDGAVVHPSNCDDGSIDSGASGADGQISIGVSSGTPPFVMVWSTGDTTAFLNDLGPGTYTVTINDGCGNPAAVESFTLETGGAGSGEPAGADVATATCDQGVAIGGGASGLGQLSQLNSGDQTDDGNVACGVTIDGIRYYSENAYLRAFDLDADFGLSGPVQIEGVDFVLTAIAGPDFGGLQPNTYKLYTASSTDLATATLTEIASVATMVPDMETNYFRAPLKATVDASEILVVEIGHPGGGADNLHQFAIGANMSMNAQPTYIRSGACGITAPTLITDIGFTQQTVMNIITRDESGNTYAWDDPNGELSATDVASPTATPTAVTTVYSVTVTDLCGNSVMDDVMVDCTVGVVNPEDAVFTISPNPSNGIFLLQNTDVAQNMALQVFDLQGKMMQAEQFNGTSHTIDLSAYAAGVYVLKLDNGVDVELHKLMVY